MKKAVIVLVILLCLGVMGYSGYKILTQLNEYRKGDATYERLEQNITIPSGTENEAEVIVHARRLPDETQDAEPERELLRIALPKVDFDALKKQNKDIVGWLYCKDTRINYPVVQGPDNDYYLHRMFTGEYNYAGCLFLESANARDFSDFNSIIYGHHMKNGSMFHDLVNFKEQKFFEEHPYIIFLTPEKNYIMEVFSGFVSSVKEDSWRIDFALDTEKEEWLKMIQEKSDFKAPIYPTKEDHLLTLSTCSYEFDNARYVLYGMLTEVLPLEEGEEESTEEY